MEHTDVCRRITEQQILSFAETLRRREYSPGTVENYIRSVRMFANWSAGTVGRTQVLQWKRWLTDHRMPATVNAALAGLNRFFEVQGWQDCRVKPLRLQHRSFSDPERELERAEYRRLVRTARGSGKERLALVMETICATGIRVGEVRYITREAAARGKAEISLKGKIRTILLPEKLCRRLLRYAKKQKITSGEIFRTRSGKTLGRVQIWSEMKRLCRDAGVPERSVFPHNLRHLFARCFYAACQDIVKLADVLGHSSIDTTRIYLLATGTEHVRQLERLHLLC